MQNINKKASILLWSIFLSLFISSVFITISLKINKSIEENQLIKEQYISNKKMNNALASWDKNTVELGENKTLTLEAKNVFETGMAKNEILEIQIHSGTNLTLTPSSGSLIQYQIGTAKPIIITEEITIPVKKIDSPLKIKNLGGFSQIFIHSEKDLEFPYKKYKVTQKIGNKEITVESGSVK